MRLSDLGADYITVPGTVFDTACPAAYPIYGGQASQGHFCYAAPAAPAAPTPAAITVSPTIQTQVSPQISPVFQQSYMPSGSPMTAGTTQTMPTSQAGTVAPADQSAALLAQQQKLISDLVARMQAPQVPQYVPPPAPAPIAPPAPMQVAAPLPIQSALPVTGAIAVPTSGDMASQLPQLGIPADMSTATAAFQGQAPIPASPPISQPASKMPMILAILAGGGILFLAMSQKGKRHATR